MNKIFQKLFGKTKKISSVQILESANFSNYGFAFFKISGVTYTLDSKYCTFYDRNSNFNVLTAQVEIAPISIEFSDLIYLEYAKVKDGTSHLENFRLTLDNSKNYKENNRKILSEFFRLKNNDA